MKGRTSRYPMPLPRSNWFCGPEISRWIIASTSALKAEGVARRRAQRARRAGDHWGRGGGTTRGGCASCCCSAGGSCGSGGSCTSAPRVGASWRGPSGKDGAARITVGGGARRPASAARPLDIDAVSWPTPNATTTAAAPPSQGSKDRRVSCFVASARWTWMCIPSGPAARAPKGASRGKSQSSRSRTSLPAITAAPSALPDAA